jgi:hypothetical protein
MAVQPIILKTDPALPVAYSEKAVAKVIAEDYIIAEQKQDGVQLNLVVKDSGMDHWLSRAGKYLPGLQLGVEGSYINFTKLLNDDMCIYPEGFMIQAEVRCKGQPAEVTAGNLRRSSGLDLSTLEVHVFAVLPLSFVESTDETFNVTNALMKYHVDAMVLLLKKHVKDIQFEATVYTDVFTLEDLQECYEDTRKAGLEGLVLKAPNAPYRRGKRTGWWKMKPEETVDGTVCGLVWGTPGLANEGKVIGFEVLLEDGCVVNACGLTEAQKTEFTQKVYVLSNRITAAEVRSHDIPSEDYNPYHGWQVEVACMERFDDGSLRHPTFNRWRGIADPQTKE